MARPLKNKKDKQVVAYKRALISAQAIQKDNALKSEKAEKFLVDIQPYLTKKGTVRKNLSQKNLAEFNLLVSQYKGGTGAPSKRRLKQGLNKALLTAKANQTYTKKKSQTDLINTFKTKTVQRALKAGIISSDQIVAAKQTFKKVTATAIVAAAKSARKELQRTTPKEALKDLQKDDYNRLISGIIENKLSDTGLEYRTEEDIY